MIWTAVNDTLKVNEHHSVEELVYVINNLLTVVQEMRDHIIEQDKQIANSATKPPIVYKFAKKPGN